MIAGKNDRWVLPEGIEELLPNDARHIESMRRGLLDLFASWGYDLVIPPFVEYTESLLTGVGSDLDLRTFKLVDLQNGRMMGIRADMTPQVARIDAHQLGYEFPTRLCYIGTVLQTRADDLSNTRSLTQIGAELFGHAGIESDIEVLSLMVAMLKYINIGDVYLDLGHVEIFRGLVNHSGLSKQQESELFDAIQRKSAPDIAELISQFDMDNATGELLKSLIWLNGDKDVLDRAREQLKTAPVSVHDAIDSLEKIADQLMSFAPGIPLHFDLAELRGYHYHTGLVFAAYKPGIGQAIVKGGRYDHIGEVFGRSRPATGFSADLRSLMRYDQNEHGSADLVFAPSVQDESLVSKVMELRAQGTRVLSELPGQAGDARAMGCNRQLKNKNGQWVVVDIS